MSHVFIAIADRLERFERWFDRRYGWFFTNGMKAQRTTPDEVLKA
jgi:hypothetical protein